MNKKRISLPLLSILSLACFDSAYAELSDKHFVRYTVDKVEIEEKKFVNSSIILEELSALVKSADKIEIIWSNFSGAASGKVWTYSVMLRAEKYNSFLRGSSDNTFDVIRLVFSHLTYPTHLVGYPSDLSLDFENHTEIGLEFSKPIETEESKLELIERLTAFMANADETGFATIDFGRTKYGERTIRKVGVGRDEFAEPDGATQKSYKLDQLMVFSRD